MSLGEADPVDQPNALLAALRYASMGLRVVPIRPATRAPMLTDWPERATTDPDTIRGWWARRPQAGVGLAMGPQPDGRTIICVDVDNHPGKPSGDDTLYDHEQTYGPLPDTVEAITGGGGRHLLFLVPADSGIRNDAAGMLLGPSIDIKSDGGQIVVAPTIHPSGRRYEWEHEHAPWEHEIAHAPGWLVALLTADQDTTPVEPPREPYNGPERPGDRWANTVTWQQLLEPDGASCLGTTRAGITLWSRPGLEGNDRHTSATTGAVKNCLHVFTTSWPGLPPGNYTKLGYLAQTQHNGDLAAASRWLVTQGHGTPRDNDFDFADTSSPSSGDTGPDPPPAGWEYEALDQHVNGTYTRPQPTFLRRT